MYLGNYGSDLCMCSCSELCACSGLSVCLRCDVILAAVLYYVCCAVARCDVLPVLFVRMQYGLKEELKADSTSATTVVDLLFIAINEGAYDTFQELRKFDEAHTRTVNIDRSNLTAPVPATSARATRSSSSSSQPEESQLQPPAQVYEQLILTCIVAGRIWWLSDLVEYKLYPVAADVGEWRGGMMVLFPC